MSLDIESKIDNLEGDSLLKRLKHNKMVETKSAVAKIAESRVRKLINAKKEELLNIKV